MGCHPAGPHVLPLAPMPRPGRPIASGTPIATHWRGAVRLGPASSGPDGWPWRCGQLSPKHRGIDPHVGLDHKWELMQQNLMILRCAHQGWGLELGFSMNQAINQEEILALKRSGQ